MPQLGAVLSGDLAGALPHGGLVYKQKAFFDISCKSSSEGSGEQSASGWSVDIYMAAGGNTSVLQMGARGLRLAKTAIIRMFVLKFYF